ncbi:MAG TPA: PQQ-dependent sugar dehydrogenase [Sphingomicrobium sp.]|jgi:glucose/arabinose dehydrogenase|nr:PQQ-dependent sugar dehydrogenase [Sphingomicrobium sp.]
MRFLQLIALLGLAACGSSAPTSARNGDGVDQPANLSPSDPPFTSNAIATFDNPWALTFLPGTNVAIVTEKPGRLWLVDVTNGQKQPVSGAPAVVYHDQGGLLDVVLSPGFGSNHLVYLTYSEPSSNGGSGLALARARLVRETGGARLEGLQVLWHDPAGGEGGQFGAIVVFARDGKSLFLSSGERQRFTPAQDMSQPLGKILHLTLDGKPAPGNPWAGKLGAQSVTVTDPPKDTQTAKHTAGRTIKWPGPNLTPSETWTLGHRNPYGLAFASDGRLWETEMGPRGGDELNLILEGKNYGWPLASEGKNYDGVPIPPHSSQPDFMAPKLYWVPSISPTSLVIYSGKMFSQWEGDGLIGTLSGKVLVHVRIRGDRASKIEQWDMGHRIRFVGEGPDGAIYLLEDESNGRLLRLTPGQTRR